MPLDTLLRPILEDAASKGIITSTEVEEVAVRLRRIAPASGYFVGSGILATEGGLFLPLDGSRAMSGILNMGENDITNVGIISLDSITGDANVIVIGDGGDSITLNPASGVNFSDKNITNVDDIALDSISSDTGTIISIVDTLAMGIRSITMTGSLAATGARVTKGWFTDVESTNMFTVGGTSIQTTFDARYLVESNNLSDLTNAATARTNIGLVAGGAGDIWVEKAGDITTGLLQTPAGVSMGEDALTDQATIAWDVLASPVARVTLEGNRTMAAPSNLNAGQTYILRVIQDVNGSRTITWNAVFTWASGNAPTLSTAANAIDLVTFYCDGTNLIGASLLNIS